MRPPTDSQSFCVMSFKSSAPFPLILIHSPLFIIFLLIFSTPLLYAQSPDESRRMYEAYRLYEEEKYGEAAELLESLHESGALGASEAALLGMSYVNLEKLEDAERAAKLSSWLDPDNYMSLLLRGNLALIKKEFPEAEKIFSRAGSLYPDRPETRNGMAAAIAGEAAALLQEGEDERAADRFADAFALKPENHRLLSGRIAALMRAGKTDELESAYRQYLQLMPKSADIHAALGVLLFDLGRREEALPHLESAVKLDTAAPAPFLILGRREEARSLIHEAIGKAVRLYGMYRMEAARRLQESREAAGGTDKQAMERLKELSESADEPRRVLEEALAFLPGLYRSEDECIEDLLRLAQWYPSSAELRQALAEAYLRAGRREAAREVWEELIRQFPLNYEGHLGLGRSHMEGGDYREASLSLRRALDISPKTEEIYVVLQRLYRKWGKERELLEIFEHRMMKDGYNPVLYHFAADTAAKLGLPEKSQEYRRRAQDYR